MAEFTEGQVYSYYDAEENTFHFQIDYYLEAADYDWYDFDNDELFYLNEAPAEAKIRPAKAQSVKKTFTRKAKKLSVVKKPSLRK